MVLGKAVWALHVFKLQTYHCVYNKTRFTKNNKQINFAKNLETQYLVYDFAEVKPIRKKSIGVTTLSKIKNIKHNQLSSNLARKLILFAL